LTWVVNVDVVFLLNFAANLPWLWLTASLAGLRRPAWRLAAGAVAGALAAVWAWFPSGRWLGSWWGVTAGTLTILAVAFLPCRASQALRSVAYFLLIGAAMAGTGLLLSRNGLPGGFAWAPVSSDAVSTGILLAAAGGRYLWEAARQRSSMVRGLFRLRIVLPGGSLELPAFVDTGNGLRDPLSGKPVAVVEARALRAVLPPDFRCGPDPLEAVERLPGDWPARCRLIPYRTVGRPLGMLLALQPSGAAIWPPGGQRWQPVDLLVGLAGHPLHPEGTYQALLPPQILGAEEAEWETTKGGAPSGQGAAEMGG
jgi:stage II sporulation protein GA (sporulation sigma-E factor processing peptidase)